jgi:NAD-dependent SIR2 family protein deacetylase
MDRAPLQRAAEALAAGDALLVGAGAGMGVDSGLPDFRGNEGFWRAYPPYARLGLRFAELANPRWFETDPHLAWGFYGHRLNLYRATDPHDGFQVLRAWTRRMPLGAFVYTSNVDGHFQRAGFGEDRVCEVHGSIHWLQCLHDCGVGIFPADGVRVAVDEDTFRAQDPLPACPSCGGLARPNVCMFGDRGWDPGRSWPQEERLNRWLQGVRGGRVVVVECGAGTAVPTVRRLCEQVAFHHDSVLIRINVREPEVPVGHLGLALPAREALHALDALLSGRG